MESGGHAEAAPQEPPRGNGKLAPHQAFLKELVAEDPGITHLSCAMHADAEGARVHHSAIANLRVQLGFT